MMSTTERAMLDQLQPAGVTQDFSDKHDISSQSANLCEEEKEQEGEILLKFIR